MKTTPDTLFHKDFSDFDELTEAARAWDLDFRQLERGPFRGSISQFIGDGAQLGHARFRRRLEQFGSPPRGMRTFVIPADLSQRLFWRGKKVGGTQIMAFPVGGELSAVSNSGFEVFTFSITDELLTERCAEAGVPDPPEIVGEKEVFQCTPRVMENLTGLCGLLHQRISESPSGKKVSALERKLKGDLPLAILTALAASRPSPAPPSPRRRSMVLQRALAYIAENMTEPITVGDLITVSGASWRTLDYAFRERFGITPKEYLKNIRLNGARRELREADRSSAKISDIANRWAFWHMGQFAADYRRLFGELPSATLVRSTRSI
ncbi:helix-turn-helix domain-containing protein [Candidatus Moduliflexota bacterium]